MRTDRFCVPGESGCRPFPEQRQPPLCKPGFGDGFYRFLYGLKDDAGNRSGSKIVDEICGYLSRNGFSSVRLGWAEGNLQAEQFWRKNGFRETGVTYNSDDYTVIVAQKDI